MTTACALFAGMKVNLRQAPVHDRDVLRDAYFVAAMWRLLGAKIVQRRRSQDTQLALLNALSLGAGQPREQVLDDRQVARAEPERRFRKPPYAARNVISSQWLR